MLTVLVALAGSVSTVALVRSARRAPSAARARRIGPRGRVLLPAAVRLPLAQRLASAGFEMTVEGAVGRWLLATSTVVLLGAAIAPVTAIVALAAGLATPPFALAYGRARARRELDAAVPALVEHVAIELRAGATVAGAIGRLPAGGCLRADEITRRVGWGAALDDAVVAWAELHDRSDVAAAAGALGMAATVGGRAADALDGLAASLRARVAALAEARAQAAQARLSALVVGCAPVAFLVVTAVGDPSSTRALVATPIGRGCLVVGLALQVVAAVWIHRIVTSEP